MTVSEIQPAAASAAQRSLQYFCEFVLGEHLPADELTAAELALQEGQNVTVSTARPRTLASVVTLYVYYTSTALQAFGVTLPRHEQCEVLQFIFGHVHQNGAQRRPVYIQAHKSSVSLVFA